jgi:hypothetical protein
MKLAYSIIIAASIVALFYLGYSLFQFNKATFVLEQHKIDSLTTEIIKLESLHVKADSTITVYKDSVIFVDKLIEIEKTKYINLKHKIDEIRIRVVHYTPTQLDSFFSSRYSDIVSSNR